MNDFAFLLGFETSLKAIDNAIQMHEWVKKNPEMIEWPKRLDPNDYKILMKLSKLMKRNTDQSKSMDTMASKL